MSWQTSESPPKEDKKHREEESEGDYKSFMNNNDELGWDADANFCALCLGAGADVSKSMQMRTDFSNSRNYVLHKISTKNR